CGVRWAGLWDSDGLGGRGARAAAERMDVRAAGPRGGRAASRLARCDADRARRAMRGGALARLRPSVGNVRERGMATMLVPTKGRYALRLMVRIAQLESRGRVALREVSEHEGISLKYLEQLARPLVQAGLLRSVRGKGGGYALVNDPSTVKVGDVLRAVEGTT